MFDKAVLNVKARVHITKFVAVMVRDRRFYLIDHLRKYLKDREIEDSKMPHVTL